jgi:hypothetical protein
MTALAVWLGLYAKSLRDRKAAVVLIEQLNGALGVKLAGPAWLRRLVGDERYFFDPAGVHFNAGERPTDDDLRMVMKHLVRFKRLRDLTLAGTGVTDAGLGYLCQLSSRLKMLDISDTKVTDAGLRRLQCLHALTTLRVHNTAVTESGVEALQHALPSCTIDFQ